jgi:hypothetical protein
MAQLIGPQLSGFLISVLRLSLWLAIPVAIFVPPERLLAASAASTGANGLKKGDVGNCLGTLSQPGEANLNHPNFAHGETALCFRPVPQA